MESSDMSGHGERSRFSFMASSASSIEAMTRPGSHCSRRKVSTTSARSESRQPEARRKAQRLAVLDGARPHALGDPRPGLREERAPADRLRRAQGRRRPERDRRELPRAEALAGVGRPQVHDRDRRRSGHASRRAPLRGRSRRCRPRRLQRARRALRLRRHPQRPPGRARRRTRPVPAGGRSRGRRDVSRLGRYRVPEGDAQDAADRGRRDRLDHPGGRDVRQASRTGRSSAT